MTHGSSFVCEQRLKQVVRCFVTLDDEPVLHMHVPGDVHPTSLLAMQLCRHTGFVIALEALLVALAFSPRSMHIYVHVVQ